MKIKLYLALAAISASFSTAVQAQSITAADDGTGTQITINGNQYDIGGGTQVDANLFHSFERFGLNQNQIANFLSNSSIRNILGRVTGGDASVINGIIQMSGGSSNLYLVNPAGIVFGANSQVNVPGSFTATSANGIQIGEFWFDALGDNNYANLVGEPGGFAFTTDNPGAIVNAGDIIAGDQITLLGGTVINTGTLETPGGTITIAAVPGKQLVNISQEGSLVSLSLPTTAENSIASTATLTPATLPELLTGGNINSATGVEVVDGTIRLTGSDVKIPNQTGTVVASGKLDVAGENDAIGGKVQILGSNIVVSDFDVNSIGTETNRGEILLEATNDIRFLTDFTVGFDVVTQNADGEVEVDLANASNGVNVDLIATAGRDILVEGNIANPTIIIAPDDQDSIETFKQGNIFDLITRNRTVEDPTNGEVIDRGTGSVRFEAGRDIQVQTIDALGSIELISRNGNITAGSQDNQVFLNSSVIPGFEIPPDNPPQPGEKPDNLRTPNDSPGRVYLEATQGTVKFFGIICSGWSGKTGDSTVTIDANSFVAKNPIPPGQVPGFQGFTSILPFPEDAPPVADLNNPVPGKHILQFKVDGEIVERILLGSVPERNSLSDTEGIPTLTTITLPPAVFVVGTDSPGNVTNNDNISGTEGALVVGQDQSPVVISAVDNELFSEDVDESSDQFVTEDEVLSEDSQVAIVCGTGEFAYAPMADADFIQGSCPGQILTYVFPTPRDEQGDPLEISPEMLPELLTPVNLDETGWEFNPSDPSVTLQLSSFRLR